MDVLVEGFVEAWRLLVSGDEGIWAVTALTLQISLAAAALAVLLGVPLGAAVALHRFWGRRLVLAAANTGFGLPPVVVGLFVTVLLWRSGPLGFLGLLYTPLAMVVAQAVIATPVVVALAATALQQVDPDFRPQMEALGATRARSFAALLGEARLPLLAASMAGFGAVVSEVGAAIMVGGNIEGETRVLTTAAVLATNRGQFALAIALGLVLLLLAFGVNLVLTFVQQRESLR
ncbi:MAG TPA: ABC transporter permease [Actinomycetales bacterium]|nr:ABC transporter permease [Actinomycetales bacterium]